MQSTVAYGRLDVWFVRSVVSDEIASSINDKPIALKARDYTLTLGLCDKLRMSVHRCLFVTLEKYRVKVDNGGWYV
jgi:hypothetical protein